MIAERATEEFATAQQKAKSDQIAAKEASEQADSASKQAKKAEALADAAEEFLQEFPESPAFSGLSDTELPNAAIALNDVGDSLEKQLKALEILQSGETENSDPIFEENTSGNGQSSELQPTNEELNGIDSALESTSPFANAEVSQVLAQALDSLDQALFSENNPFSDATDDNPPIEGQRATKPSQSETPEPISNNQPNYAESTPGEPDEPIPGYGQGIGGSGLFSSPTNFNNQFSQALQALQHATEVQAQAMSQQRSNIMLSEAKGNQFNSSDSRYQEIPVPGVGKLPVFETIEDGEDWGKLPPKLAKDLMEAKRERVSESYRNQVQAYFQAMSQKARTNKK